MKWFVVFPDEWLAYSPTVINFVKSVRERGDSCQVICIESGGFVGSCSGVDPVTVRLHSGIRTFLARTRILPFVKIALLGYRLKKLGASRRDRIVGVDAVGYLASSLVSRRVIYLSLEVVKDFWHRLIVRFFPVDTLIIQSEERRSYLGLNEKKCFFIQNAPIVDAALVSPRESSKELVYFGTVSRAHGVEACIDSLAQLPDARLTIKGISREQDSYVISLKKRYAPLIDAGRLIFDFRYLLQEEIPGYLASFDIGFCLYDRELIAKGDFNYISCPSGKMFNYFASGIPVIGSNIVGLSMISEERAGVLIDDPSALSIAHAVSEIRSNFALFSAGALRLASLHDFRSRFTAFYNGMVNE